MKAKIELTKNPESNHYLKCYRFALDFVKTTKLFSSEDLKEAYLKAKKPQPKEPRVWGAVMRELHNSGLITKGGMSNYKNPVGHCRPINTWKSLCS
jgi:hypothetical protein